MQVHFDVLMDCFVREHRTGKYGKLSDNPYFEEVKALVDSMNVLRKYLGWEIITLKQEVQYRL